MNRSIVYIDGFNLYYGAIRGGPHKWLDLQRYFELLRQRDDIRRIYYYTALIDGPRRCNQETYLKALATLPLVQIVLGRFKIKEVKCVVHACHFRGPRTFTMPEEKRTDVNIAIQILEDAYQNRCDRFVIVGGDSDLVPAANKVKSLFPSKKIIVYVPSRNPIRGAAVELRSAADRHKTMPLKLLKRAQLPLNVPDGGGGVIVKPRDW